MTLEEEFKEEFEKQFKEWERYCDIDCFFSHDLEDYAKSDAYRKLVEMGKPILKLVYEKYKQKPEMLLDLLIEGVVGEDFKTEFSVRDVFKKDYSEHPLDVFDDHEKVQKNSLKWLEENLQKYT